MRMMAVTVEQCHSWLFLSMFCVLQNRIAGSGFTDDIWDVVLFLSSFLGDCVGGYLMARNKTKTKWRI